MAIGGNWGKLLGLGVVVGAGFSIGTYLAKALIGGLQNVSGFNPTLASYWADWNATLPPEEAYIPYRSYQGAAFNWPKQHSYGELNELPYVPYASADYMFDF